MTTSKEDELYTKSIEATVGLVELAQQKDGQAMSMLVCAGGDHEPAECGHWYSPDLVRSMLQSLAAENAELRSQVKEWACESCNIVFPGPPQKGFASVQCRHCLGRTMPKETLLRRRAEAERDALQRQIEEAQK